MALANLLFVLIGTAVAWWLSKFDSRVTGEDLYADYSRRAIRTGITFVLLASAMLNGFAAIFIFVSLGIYWASCGAEFFSGQIHKLIDPEDKRPFDPKETDRNLDRLAKLVREGKTEEALDWCLKLQAAGEGSALALEATVHRLYQDNLKAAETSPLLSEVLTLCERDQVEQAESRLEFILSGQPKNWPAMLLLMRVYAEGLSQPEKALAMLEPAAKQPRLHPAFAQYARESIKEWSTSRELHATDSSWVPAPPSLKPSSSMAASEISIDELLKNNQLATAVEHLEKAIAQDPKSFDLLLKLAEVYGVYCSDLNRAEKIVRKLELSSTFSPQEKELAKARLKEWRAVRR